MSRDPILNLLAELQNLKRRVQDLERKSGGLVEAGGGGGLSIRGTPVLYAPIICREYNTDGTLIAVGAETGAADRSLQPTIDRFRMMA